jgi:tRNA A37 threonylcarbamoyladenosine synthetase subunit TsaC/SUA5/YrdC
LWEVAEILEEMGSEIDFIVEARGFASRTPSTIVKVIGDEVMVLRAGPIGAEALGQVTSKISDAT